LGIARIEVKRLVSKIILKYISIINYPLMHAAHDDVASSPPQP
jgi:hypothetical protein